MPSLDTEKLSSAVKAKREKSELSLRRCQDEAKLSAHTLFRIEQGKVPDSNTLIKVLHWLKMGLNSFVKKD